MARLKRGTRVIVTEPIKRGQNHRHGPAKVKKGAKALVVDRHTKGRFRKVTAYDLDVDDGLRAQFVPAVSESSLRRAPRLHLARVLLVGVLVLVVVQALAERLG